MSWVKLGIVPQRSRLASPQDNGRHERMHSTLQQATLRPPERNPRRQQEAFDRFQHEFNHERPHEALENATPASCYTVSSWQMPRRIPELEYGDDVIARRTLLRSVVRTSYGWFSGYVPTLISARPERRVTAAAGTGGEIRACGNAGP